MEGKEPSIPRYFIRIMLPGFHQKLNLPAMVSKEVEKQKSRKAVLKSRIGAWRINLCRNKENGVICLKQGWPQFVERHDLTIGEILVFQHTGDLHFNVAVFNTNLCENEFRDVEEKKEEDGTHETLNPTTEEEEDCMFFEKTMIPRHATKLAIVNIPLEFMRWNNLGVEHRSVVLRDPCSGKKWDVKLLMAEKRIGFRYRMLRGWQDFYASNALKDGDRCVFRLNRRLLTSDTIVFDVEIIRAN